MDFILEKCKVTSIFLLEKCILLVLPIEVKSGMDYERHNALSNVMANEEYDVPQAYVFCQENIQTKGKITYYPIYMITFLEKIQTEEGVYKFDLTGL